MNTDNSFRRHRCGIVLDKNDPVSYTMRVKNMKLWCEQNVNSDTWDTLDIPPINGCNEITVFRFDRQEDLVPFQLTM